MPKTHFCAYGEPPKGGGVVRCVCGQQHTEPWAAVRCAVSHGVRVGAFVGTWPVEAPPRLVRSAAFHELPAVRVDRLRSLRGDAARKTYIRKWRRHCARLHVDPVEAWFGPLGRDYAERRRHAKTAECVASTLQGWAEAESLERTRQQTAEASADRHSA